MNTQTYSIVCENCINIDKGEYTEVIIKENRMVYCNKCGIALADKYYGLNGATTIGRTLDKARKW